MLKTALKLGGSIAKSTKSPGDIIKAGSRAVELANKIAKPKKAKQKDENERKPRARR